MKKKLKWGDYAHKQSSFQKIHLTMKLTLLLTVILTFQVSASVFSQKISLNEDTKGETVRSVLKIIEKQTNVRFFYNEDFKQLNEVLSQNITSGSLDEMLEKICTPARLTFKLMDNNFIVIYPVGMVQTIKVNGSITDAVTGEPILGANVTIEGTTSGTVTDIDGKFTIDVPSQQSVLVISFVGYLSEKVVVGNQTTIDLKLAPGIKSLEEVVVVGYGVQRKSDLSGAISSVKAADIENRSVVKVEQALQGKTAGVQIIQTSGSPGATATIRVRGYSSNSGSDPLYVVDGLRTKNVGAIDPNNIENIEILKDAASAAIYGAEAGNGVVLITTKSGKKGGGQVMYDFQYSVNQFTRIPRSLNAQEYINYMTEANYIQMTEINQKWDGKTDTNWADIAFENSVMAKHNLAFQGGNDKGSYYLALTSLNQDGIITGGADTYRRITGMINADYSPKKWLKVGTTNTIEKWERKAVSENSEYGSLLSSVITLDPLTPNVYDPDNVPAYMQTLINQGRIFLKNEKGQYYAPSQIYEAEQTHPMIMRDRTKPKDYGVNVLGTIYADFTPVKNLKFTSKLSYNVGVTNNYSFAERYYANGVLSNNFNTTSRSNSNNTYYQWENFANYDLEIGKSNITALAGISYSDNYTTLLNGSVNALIKDDPLFRDLSYASATATRTVGGSYIKSRSFSYFGRINYDYNRKYGFTAILRRDAADLSYLPKANRWGSFPSISARYIISNEDFFPKNTAITHLKLRVSWGQNGSLGPLGGYSYIGTISSSGSYPYSNDIAYQVASSPSRLNNDEITWETSEQINYGLDLRAFNDRFNVGVDYYIKKTKDLLVAAIPPKETGVSTTTINAGNVENKGLELDLGWSDNIGEFKYSIRGNLATLKNKVTYLDRSITRLPGVNFHTNLITAFEVGKPVWYMYGYNMIDVDDATGDPVFEDQKTVDTNNDGIPDAADGVINDNDKVMIGKGIPDLTYGLTFSANYKGVDFTIFGTGSEGNDIFNAFTRPDRPRGNKLKLYYDDRWTPTNTTASRPRAGSNGDDKYWGSNMVVFDGSYFKIKQIQVGYTIPKKLAQKAFMNNLRVYVSFDDWFVFTKYKGLDPEASAGTTSAIGVDKGAYPTYRKLLFGFNLTL